ncbi:accessory factor UbiK family protein [Elioraea rosea]|uniref:accessory factor UbiK family protein n=1 Tax=Elioraea rosea TaxID=2492390 RepID=UPI0011838C7A|nr:accessory factor UbiK family protein [Elioraea rosea]
MRGKVADDLAGVAGGAFSALAGLRRELGELVRSGTDEMAQRLALASREEVDVLRDLLDRALAEHAALEARLGALESRIALLETRPEPKPARAQKPAPPAAEEE